MRLISIALALALGKALPAAAATVTVTGSGDTIAIDGLVTLREAITSINAGANTSDVVAVGAYGTSDRIVFSIGSGLQTISPTSDLPAITASVVIDATTQPGFAGTPIIVLNGSSAGYAAGFVLLGGTSTVRGFVINGFRSNGITIVTNNSSGNTIAGNYIGIDATGTVAAPNFGYGGISIEFRNGNEILPSSNVIGGVTALDRNVISGNAAWGIALATGSGDMILGNRIGTNASGTAAVGNRSGGIRAWTGTIVGGTDPGAGNLISGNHWWGIYTEEDGAKIAGNFIGTNAAGTAAIPNSAEGVRIMGGGDNLIGGSVAGSRNVISGNADGIRMGFYPSRNNAVLGNYIGTDVTGTLAIGNTGSGIALNSADNTIIVGNVISGNSFYGIVAATGSPGTSLNGNRIGTDAAGINPLPNMAGGVVIDSLLVSVGGRFADVNPSPNTIAFNGGPGILITSSQSWRSNSMFNNSIFSNAGLGIDINGDGPTPNDPGDADTGPNGLQNFPVITAAWFAGGVTTINFTLNSTPNTRFRIDVYRNPACDPSGFGEGQSFVSTFFGSTDAAGNLAGTLPVPANITGQVVTALATSDTDDTSEFSACALVGIVAPTATPTPTITPTPTTTPTPTGTPTPTPAGSTPTPSPTRTVSPGPGGAAPSAPIPTVSFPGLALLGIALASVGFLFMRRRF